MAAVASPPKQDVGYQSYQQQESPSCDDNREAEPCIKSNSSKLSNESEDPIEEVVVSGETKKFTLGIDDGTEFMDEVSFALQHCVQPLHQPRQGIGDQDDPEAAGQIVVGQPPPGHWVSQPHGELFCIVLTRTT